MTNRTIILLFALLFASAAFAQQDVSVNFESVPPSSSNAPVTVGVATFSGGIVAEKLLNLPENQSHAYFTSTNENCHGCNASRDVTITFSKPVSNVSFDLYNGLQKIDWPTLIFYHVYINDETQSTPYFFGHFRDPENLADWFYRINVFNEKIHKIRIHPGPESDYWNYTLDNFEFTVNRTIPVQLVTGFGDPNNDPNAKSKEIGGKQVQLHVPIGGNFYMKLQRKNSAGTWVDVLSRFGPGNSFIAEKDKLLPNALWRDYAAFQFGDKNAPDIVRRFQAVHFGNVNVFIDPTDDSIGPLSVALYVIQSGLSLGPPKPPTGPRSIRNDPTFDGRFIQYANRTGVPPQYLKGQADQESELGIGIMDPLNWRYELYTTDSDFVQKFKNNCKLISQARQEWYPYGCEKWPSFMLPSGSLLCPRPPILQPGQSPDCGFAGTGIDDLAPRYREDLNVPLKLSRAGEIRTIRPGDDPVMGYDIHYAKSGIVIGVKPGTPTPVPKPGRRRPSGKPSTPPYDFVAQTTLASSYGLMQVLWTTANDFDLKWTGVNGRHNPALLFDTTFGENNNGGSFEVGTRYLVKFFDNQNPASLAQTPNFASTADFETALQNMFQAYNQYKVGYGAAVMAKSSRYAPQYTSFFPFSVCSAPVITSQTTSVIAGSAALLGVVAEGEDLLKYEWFEQRAGSAPQKIATTTDPQLSVNAASGSSYSVMVTSECGGSVSSATIPVVTHQECTSPRITQAPEDDTVARGHETSLFVTVTGNASVQWYVGEVGTAPGDLGDQSSPVPNGNAPTIVVSPQTTTKYWVLVQNSCGADTAAVTLTVCDAPKIVTDPQTQTIVSGSSAPLSVTVTSPTPVAYQWYTGLPPNISAPVDGATSESLNVSPTASTSYWVRATNDCSSTNSAPAFITVNDPCVQPSISAQSGSTSLVRGASTTLSVTPAGSTPRTIQWYRGTPASSTPIDGAMEASYPFTPAETGQYFAVVTNACGSATSTPVTITVNEACVPASISTQSSSTSIERGEVTTLSIAPAGSTPRAIQWYRGLPGSATSINGENDATLSASPVTTTTFFAVVTNDCGEATSTPVTITVTEPCLPASIAGQSSSVTIIRGESTTLSITPSGSTPRTIQWYTGTPGAGSSLPIDAANAPTLDVAPLAITSYFAIVTNACGTDTSTPVTITPTAACVQPSIGDQSGSTSIVRGESTTLSVTASGTSPRTVQWYTGTPANLSIIDGATGSTHSVSPNATTSYFAIVSNACGAANSTPVTITVTDACVPASITSQSGSTSIDSGESTVLSVTTTGSSPRSIQWFLGIPGNASPISGATSANYTASPDETTTYFARVTNTCGSDESNPVTVVVDCLRPSITSQPQEATIEQGQQATLSVSYNLTANDVTTVQWYSDGAFFGPIPGATSPTLQVSPESSRRYFARVTNSCGSTDSLTVWVNVNPPSCDSVFITQQPANQSITDGQSATVTVVATGTSPQYQWQQNINSVWTNLVGKTAASLTVTPSPGTYQYRVMVSNSCTLITSSVVTVTVGVPCTPPVITQQPVDPNFTIAGQSAELTVGATGSNLQYQWYRNGALWDLATGPTIQVFTSTVAQRYYCVVSNACGSQTSIEIAIEAFCAMPQTTIVSVSDPVVPPGGSSVLSVNSSGLPLLHWTLYERPVGSASLGIVSSGKGTSVPNATVVPSATSDYWYEVSNECGSASSNVVRITVQ